MVQWFLSAEDLCRFTVLQASRRSIQIPQPRLGGFPAEWFGCPYTVRHETATAGREEQRCPFLADECKKPRRREPHIKTGICTVGYKGEFQDDFGPVMICPHRFSVTGLHKAIPEWYFGDLNEDARVAWVNTGGTEEPRAEVSDRTAEDLHEEASRSGDGTGARGAVPPSHISMVIGRVGLNLNHI
jgi:hypothetical protein